MKPCGRRRWAVRSPVDLTLDLRHWVDGLMMLFLFVVGLEIKRELVEGELNDARRAALPVCAALGGMIIPAALFALLNQSGPGSNGWGIPMATDIAIAAWGAAPHRLSCPSVVEAVPVPVGVGVGVGVGDG